MTETKVYKLHESKQVEDITTMLKIEGIKYKVFEYEEYIAIEVTGTPLEIMIVLGCLYAGYRLFKKPGEHFFDI